MTNMFSPFLLYLMGVFLSLKWNVQENYNGELNNILFS